jgi:hypothetical protein
MIPAFPKVFTLGDRYISNIFDDPVEITEKVDGSMFAWGKIDGQLYCRSKNKLLILDAPEKMFKTAVDYIISIKDKLVDGMVYFGEYLNKPKHNTLMYRNVPKNNIALFGAAYLNKVFVSEYESLKTIAEGLDIDVVPLLYQGKMNPNSSAQILSSLLDRESFLGRVTIEGVVVKNYHKDLMVDGRVIPVMCGKFVSKKFKEKHQRNWSKEHTGKGKWQIFKENFRTEARWNKAVQHLKEKGELEGSPRDIGKLVKEIRNDIVEEEKHTIMEWLWKQFGSVW